MGIRHKLTLYSVASTIMMGNDDSKIVSGMRKISLMYCNASSWISLSEFLWIFCFLWLYMSFRIFTNSVNDIMRTYLFTSTLLLSSQPSFISCPLLFVFLFYIFYVIRNLIDVPWYPALMDLVHRANTHICGLLNNGR